jgi:hypothetical protein
MTKTRHSLGRASLRIAFVCIMAPVSNLIGAGLAVPTEEKFATSRLPEGWTEEVSTGTKLELKNDGLHFNGPAHGKGHLKSECGKDLITVSAKIAQWGAVYLVWDENSWCSAGQISPTPFGRLFSSIVTKREGDEEDHRGINFGPPRWVRIQLGENFIRFFYSDDEKQWTELRTVPRPKVFAGAPKWFVVGKYYETEDRPFAIKAGSPTSDSGTNAYGDQIWQGGDKIGGRILEVKVEETHAGKRKLSGAEVKKLREPKVDPVTAAVRKSKADPSYESIVSFYPPFKLPREVVGVPVHPLDIGVDRLGRFDVSPWSAEPVAWFEVGEPGTPLGKDGEPFKRRLKKGYLPIDTLSINRSGADYELTIFGWSEDFDVEKPLYAYACLRAKIAGNNASRKAALVAPKKQRKDFELKDEPKGTAAVCLRFKFPEPGTVEEISAQEFESKEAEVAKRWEEWLAPATRFEVPERRVMEAYRAWLTYSLINADTVNGYIEPHDGTGFYDEMFGNSVSVHTMALDMYGLHDYAAKILDMQRHFQQTNGLYTQVCGLTDPGGFLVGLARHYRMTADKTWLERVKLNIINQCNWSIAQRQKTPTTGVTRGLIKFRPYNDYVAEVYNYLGNVWCAQGLAETAAALETIGAPEAKNIAVEAQKYRKDILDSMEAAAFKHQGQTLLPLEPDTHRMLKLERYKGAGYYCLSASPLLGIGFLSAWDKPTTLYLDALEKRGGLIAGLCEFETGIDHAYTYGYLLNALRRGEPRKTLLGFYSMLAFGMTRDTYSPVEVTMIETGENHLTLPHLYSCTEQLRLLRALLITDEGNELKLGEAIPRQWLEPGKKVSVKAAPTEFGNVSYEIRAREDGSMDVHIDPPKRQTPSKMTLKIRAPGERKIAKVAGAAGVKFSNETIVLPKSIAPLDLIVNLKN